MSRKGPNKISLVKEVLQLAYWGDPDATWISLAARYGVVPSTIARWLKYYGIPSKGRKGYHHNPVMQIRDKEWLVEQFRTKTQTQIAQELHVSKAALSYWINKFGLNTGNRGQDIRNGLAKKYPAESLRKENARLKKQLEALLG